MNKLTLKNKIKDAFKAYIIGDCLGRISEFKPRGLLDLYPVHDFMTGDFSDDTSMTFETIKTMLNQEDFTYPISNKDLMDSFIDWRFNGDMTPNGVVVDVGVGTNKVLKVYKEKGIIKDDSNFDVNNNGNGALMRIFPVILKDLFVTKKDEYLQVASLTHGHEISNGILCITKKILKYLLVENLDFEASYDKGLKEIALELERNDIDIPELHKIPMTFKELKALDRDDIRSGGYVVDTFIASMWSVASKWTTKGTLLLAINLGNDTDTIGAIAGFFAGLIYGLDSDLNKWWEKVSKKEMLEDYIEKFSDKVTSFLE